MTPRQTFGESRSPSTLVYKLVIDLIVRKDSRQLSGLQGLVSTLSQKKGAA